MLFIHHKNKYSSSKNKHLKTIIDKRFNQQNISQAWIKMYEIINMFHLIPKNKTTYKYYIRNRNKLIM